VKKINKRLQRVFYGRTECESAGGGRRKETRGGQGRNGEFRGRWHKLLGRGCVKGGERDAEGNVLMVGELTGESSGVGEGE